MEKWTLRVIVPLTTRYSGFLQSKKLSLTIIVDVRDIYLVSLVHNTCWRLEFWQPDGLIQQWFIIDQTRWLKTTRRCYHNPWLRKKKSNNFIVQICNSDTSFSGNKYIKCMNLLTYFSMFNSPCQLLCSKTSKYNRVNSTKSSTSQHGYHSLEQKFWI